MFARNITKNNDFDKAFGNTPTNGHTIEPRQTEKRGTSRAANLNPINTDESSFFDFEPSSRAESPYQNQFSTIGASDMTWNNDGNFRPFTPPSSASFSPKNWPFNNYQSGNPSNIFTSIQPTNTRSFYEQPTPPDDEDDYEILLEHRLQDQREQQAMQLPQDGGKGKRKRNGTKKDSISQSSPKRPRKYVSRRWNNNNEPTKPEDVKRSKFLERNRVAASKCRQKKKEWTQNLENRAREFQKDNNQLRMVVDSCRQEILFLKGELLKHNQCECEGIQTFIKSGINNVAEHKYEDDLFKRETSAIERRSSSRPSILDGKNTETDVDSTSPTEPSNISIAEDDNALEALLTSSMNLDMLNEGIASQIPVAAAA